MTRDLLRTVINKQKVKSNIGLNPQSKAASFRTISTKNTIKPQDLFDTRRHNSQSTQKGKTTKHHQPNKNSANITRTNGFEEGFQISPTTDDLEDLDFAATTTGFENNKKRQHTQGYPFSLLETIFAENSTNKTRNPAHAAMQATQPRVGSASASAASRTTSAALWMGTSSNKLLAQTDAPYQELVQVSAGRNSLRESIYRRTHRSGGYRTEPNTFG